MATWTYEESTEHNNYQNLTVYDCYRDGVLANHKLVPNEDYVMYDSNSTDYGFDENDNLIEVTNYYTQAFLPLTYNWDNFSWVAVLRSEVDENYIFRNPTDEEYATAGKILLGVIK